MSQFFASFSLITFQPAARGLAKTLTSHVLGQKWPQWRGSSAYFIWISFGAFILTFCALLCGRPLIRPRLTPSIARLNYQFFAIRVASRAVLCTSDGDIAAFHVVDHLADFASTTGPVVVVVVTSYVLQVKRAPRRRASCVGKGEDRNEENWPKGGATAMKWVANNNCLPAAELGRPDTELLLLPRGLAELFFQACPTRCCLRSNPISPRQE